MRTPGRQRIVAIDTDVTIAFGSRIMIAVWRKDVTLQRLLTLGREIRDFLPSCRGKGYASVTVIEPGISLRLPDDARSASEAMQREFAPNIKCLAYLVTQEGFVAAAARTLASGMALVTRAPYPLKILANATDTAKWVSGYIELMPLEIESLIIEARETRKT